MRLVCPNCGKAHLVRPEALGVSGRAVRCAACKTTWQVSAMGESLGRVSPSTQANTQHFVKQIRNAAEQVQRPSASARPQRKKAPGRSLLKTIEPGAAILGALMLLLVSMAVFSVPVVEAVPRLARLYASIGMPVNIRGLEFGEIKVSRAVDAGGAALLIEGKISNITSGKIEVPPVRVTLISPTGTAIDTVTVKPETASLEHSAETIFKSRLANPPQDAKDVLVKFSSTGLQAGS